MKIISCVRSNRLKFPLYPKNVRDKIVLSYTRKYLISDILYKNYLYTSIQVKTFK